MPALSDHQLEMIRLDIVRGVTQWPTSVVEALLSQIEHLEWRIANDVCDRTHLPD